MKLVEKHGRKTAAAEYLKKEGWTAVEGTKGLGFEKNGERVKIVRYATGWWRIEAE